MIIKLEKGRAKEFIQGKLRLQQRTHPGKSRREMICRKRRILGPFQISANGWAAMLPATRCRHGEMVPSGKIPQPFHGALHSWEKGWVRSR